MKLNPLDDRVVVEPLGAEETTAGGIVLPDAAQEKPQRGTVVAVGPGRLLESGERAAVGVVVGDEVLFGKFGGADIEVDGREVKILRESDTLAMVGYRPEPHTQDPSSVDLAEHPPGLACPGHTRSQYPWPSNCCSNTPPESSSRRALINLPAPSL